MSDLPVAVSERLGWRANLPAVQKHFGLAERRALMTAWPIHRSNTTKGAAIQNSTKSMKLVDTAGRRLQVNTIEASAYRQI
jgi:hypothetical protein